jgi:hypothetical protein
VLLARTRLLVPDPNHQAGLLGRPVRYGQGLFESDAVRNILKRFGLPHDEALTVLAAETFADPPETDPLGDRLGHARILRISPLIPVPDAC